MIAPDILALLAKPNRAVLVVVADSVGASQFWRDAQALPGLGRRVRDVAFLPNGTTLRVWRTTQGPHALLGLSLDAVYLLAPVDGATMYELRLRLWRREGVVCGPFAPPGPTGGPADGAALGEAS